ncbi:hypothetical protein L228DRAFT_275082 [Xylona heveae TC161]|uniref:SWIM-type domain-containing protein n=1 Tax=Xylona heveae (strain CBS 132557 / TC161) TaxID=1328760 RepID=A0A161THK1_XYLHT|nr:hypothetical protein L228DRAFT_275082 [Xylona heveae TC161]KZF25727.1 hypothetical protein L228DRAFT_275082 [Xylona heveae TC161]
MPKGGMGSPSISKSSQLKRSHETGDSTEACDTLPPLPDENFGNSLSRAHFGTIGDANFVADAPVSTDFARQRSADDFQNHIPQTGSSRIHSQTTRSTETSQAHSVSPESKRRKTVAPRTPTKREVIDLTGDDDDGDNEIHRRNPNSPSKSRKNPSTPKKQEEKRLRVFRNHAPRSYLVKLERALTQRMFVLNRSREGSTPESPSEVIDLAGSTGNVYGVTIAHLPRCTCPDYSKGNQCKHIIYVLVNILKAPEHLQYQLAFLTSELHTIFENALLPIHKVEKSEDQHPGKRKPVEGDCPICFTEMKASENTVWCKASCGNNIHKDCFQKWTDSQQGLGVTCVYCRALWPADDDTFQRMLKYGEVNDEGYVNVGEQLGMSEDRDTSTYHWPRRRRRRYGSPYDWWY